MKANQILLVGFAMGLFNLGTVGAAQIFTDRDDWLNGFIGPHWDVDLEDGVNNNLQEGGTLGSGSPIQIPPSFTETLSFDKNLAVQRGDNGVWENYINKGYNPLVLASSASELVGTFSLNGFGKFGFEILSDINSEITLTLSDGTKFKHDFQATGVPQFFGWIAPEDEAIKSFTISSTGGGFLIGNFVVPDTGTTFGLFGIGLLVLGTARQRFA